MKCYICQKEIYEKEEYYDIGKNKEGEELYRHKKCRPRGKLRMKK